MLIAWRKTHSGPPPHVNLGLLPAFDLHLNVHNLAIVVEFPLCRLARTMVGGRLPAMDDYTKFRYSVTCETADSAVLHCLRALCQWAEEHPKPQIGWGGTTKKNGCSGSESVVTPMAGFATDGQPRGCITIASSSQIAARCLAAHTSRLLDSSLRPAQ